MSDNENNDQDPTDVEIRDVVERMMGDATTAAGLPKLRLFRVIRINDYDTGTTEVYVEAHAVQPSDGMLLFQSYVLEGGAAVAYLRRGFARGSWADFEEVFTAAPGARTDN